MEEKIIYKTECEAYSWRKGKFKYKQVPYPSRSVIDHFFRNGISLRKLLELLYENKIDYRNLYAVHNKDTRMIFKNEIIKPIFIGTADRTCIYIKCKDTRYCDVWIMNVSEFNKIAEEQLYLTKMAVIAKRDKIDNDIIRFCKRLKTKVYIKEDCTKEARQTVKNTKNIIKLKKIKELMKKIHNEEGIIQ